ncbi:MAG: hypothetical protein OEU36_25195 [Gammaproteobacteria bacterium]|nr:hypothetical protein [Gammaproteobacteria bacterium]
MSKRSNRPRDDFDEFALFSDPDFDTEAFIEFMARGCANREERTARQRVDDWSEVKWLQDQLYDLDDTRDWNDTHDRDDWNDGNDGNDWNSDEEIEWH